MILQHCEEEWGYTHTYTRSLRIEKHPLVFSLSTYHRIAACIVCQSCAGVLQKIISFCGWDMINPLLILLAIWCYSDVMLAVVIIAFYGPNRPCYQTGEEAHALPAWHCTRCLTQAQNAQARRIRRKHTRVWYPHFPAASWPTTLSTKITSSESWHPIYFYLSSALEFVKSNPPSRIQVGSPVPQSPSKEAKCARGRQAC